MWVGIHAAFPLLPVSLLPLCPFLPTRLVPLTCTPHSVHPPTCIVPLGVIPLPVNGESIQSLSPGFWPSPLAEAGASNVRARNKSMCETYGRRKRGRAARAGGATKPRVGHMWGVREMWVGGGWRPALRSTVASVREDGR